MAASVHVERGRLRGRGLRTPALLAAHAFAIRGRTRAFALGLGAFVSLALAHAVFWLYTQPANLATAYWTRMPEGFEHWRSQWEISHAAAALLTFGALVLLLSSIYAHGSRRASGRRVGDV